VEAASIDQLLQHEQLIWADPPCGAVHAALTEP
jgi:hypothetical protein